jgi:hypothetical protein
MMSLLFNAKVLAWDKEGKVLEISYWQGFDDLEQAKTFTKKWFQHNHVGCEKKIKIYEEGSRMAVVDFNNFKIQPKKKKNA